MDACKPGDRVSVVGIYKAVPPRANGTTSGQFRAVLVANNVKRMVRDAGVYLCRGVPPQLAGFIIIYLTLVAQEHDHCIRQPGGCRAAWLQSSQLNMCSVRAAALGMHAQM